VTDNVTSNASPRPTTRGLRQSSRSRRVGQLPGIPLHRIRFRSAGFRRFHDDGPTELDDRPGQVGPARNQLHDPPLETRCLNIRPAAVREQIANLATGRSRLTARLSIPERGERIFSRTMRGSGTPSHAKVSRATAAGGTCPGFATQAAPSRPEPVRDRLAHAVAQRGESATRDPDEDHEGRDCVCAGPAHREVERAPLNNAVGVGPDPEPKASPRARIEGFAVGVADAGRRPQRRLRTSAGVP
jgi:hypothetical protein